MPNKKPETFRSVDGTDRCNGCHLHPPDCTCGEAGQRWLRFFLELVERSRWNA